MEDPNKVVNTAPDQMPTSEGVKTQEQLPAAPVVASTSTAPQPGEKTDPALLLKSLQEERMKRQELEDQIKSLTTTVPLDNEVYSDEGRLLKQQIDQQARKIAELEEQRELERLQNFYPELKESAQEFKTFLQDYPRHKIENVAKIFLAEKGYLEPARKGLEKPTSGPRTPPTSGMSAEDSENLRKTNYRKWREMVDKDQMKLS